MRSSDGRIIVDLGDNVTSVITGSISVAGLSDIDENTTAYSLLPERINAVPYVSTSIYDTSIPQIKPIQFNDPGKNNLFIDSQGIVKVAIGTSFVLRFVGEQPPIYNIENGLPVIFYDQTQLVYEWQRDGEIIVSQVDNTRPNSFIITSGSKNNELIFSNVSPQFAGTYACVVSNDIGSTQSEQVTVEVYNPDIEDLFYKNLIDNPYGKDGTNGWSSPDQEFITNRLTNTNFKNLSEPWKRDTFGYSIDMFYPRPYQLNTFHIKNSNLAQDLMQEGYYFTREKFKYRIKDGKAIINASYDIDLSDVQDYIQGSVYGIEGVRAIFGCYIGNAITKFGVTIISAYIMRRSTKYSLLPSIIRLSIANSLLSGKPNISENIKVTVQEYDNETPLLSLVKYPTYSALEPGHTFTDKWTSTLLSVPDMQSITSTITPTKILPEGTSTSAKILYIAENNLLFPSLLYVPTYGQYVGFKKGIIDKLNFRTNKIRISLIFESNDYVISLTERVYTNASDECFEYAIWEPIQKVDVWPVNSSDYYSVSGSLVSIDTLNKTYYDVSWEEPFRYTTQLGQPRALATGFNLVLLPIETGSLAKLDYYTKTILEPTEDPPTYPDLQTGVSTNFALGLYFSTLANYQYEIIGVHIKNKYNQPTAVGNEFELAKGEVPTRTSITTYRYNKQNTNPTPNALGFEVSGSVWTKYPLNGDATFGLANPAEQFTVLYVSESNSELTQANIDQVIGNIETKAISYTNNLVTDIADRYTTMSINKGDYLNKIGFRLNLVAEDRGVSGSSQTDWSTLVGSTPHNHVHRLLPEVGTTPTGIQFIPNENDTQHYVYSNQFYQNFGSLQYPENQQNRQNLYSEVSSFFTKKADIEIGTTYYGVGANVDYDTADGQAFDQLRTNMQNGLKLTIRRDNLTTYNLGQTKVPTNYDVTDSTTVNNGITTYRVRYTEFVSGSTDDIIKMPTVSTEGMYTPAAIVVPSQQKVYYFLYFYQDNIAQERI